MSQGLVRTLRIRSERKAGNLGVLTTALGDAGALIGEVSTVRTGHNYMLRDFQLFVDDEEHFQQVLASVESLAGSSVVEVIDPVEHVHRGGKLRTRSRVDFGGMQEFSAAMLPGVRQIVQAIDDDPTKLDEFTSAPRTVAVISDGSGVVGMHKVKPRAALPVVEGVSALLARMAGLNALPLILDIDTEEHFVESVMHLSASCAGIVIEGVASPRGPRVVQKLSERLQIPVYHDDADGPAIVGLAAVVNACRKVGRDVQSATIGQIGLGTAGGAIARLVMRHTGKPVLGEDMHPASLGRHIGLGGIGATLEEIMQKADVVVMNTGHAGLVPPSTVREGQVLIALSEPHPEIDPYDALLAGAAFAADGKAISPAAALPGVMLGALAVRARVIDDEMRVAAALSMIDAAEGGDLVPTPLTDGLHARVAAAVAKAAVRNGNARAKVDEALLVPDVFAQLIDDVRMMPLGVG